MNLDGPKAKDILDAVKKELTNEAANGDIEALKAVLKELGVRNIQPGVTDDEAVGFESTSTAFIHKHVNQLREIYPSSELLKPKFRTLGRMYHPDKGDRDREMIALGSINDYMDRIYEEPKVKGFLEVLTKLGITLSEKETPKRFDDLMEIGLVKVKRKYPTKQDLEQKRVTNLSDSGEEALEDIVERMSRMYKIISAYLRALRALQIYIDASSSHAETLDALLSEVSKQLQLKCTTLKEFKSKHENAKKELDRDMKDRAKKDAAEAALEPLQEIYNMMIPTY
jgi:curved DNA-binding protein CbpA